MPLEVVIVGIDVHGRRAGLVERGPWERMHARAKAYIPKSAPLGPEGTDSLGKALEIMKDGEQTIPALLRESDGKYVMGNLKQALDIGRGNARIDGPDASAYFALLDSKQVFGIVDVRDMDSYVNALCDFGDYLEAVAANHDTTDILPVIKRQLNVLEKMEVFMDLLEIHDGSEYADYANITSGAIERAMNDIYSR